MFDLDGTLTDSRVGVTRCIEHALAEARVAPPAAEALIRCVGPPLSDSFAALLDTTDTEAIERAIASYRRRFEHVGMFENSLFPGVVEMLEAFATHHELYIVTAKPRVYALQILEQFDIAYLFRHVHGPELNTRNYTKASLIREVCRDTASTTGTAMMIGDRADDVRGAKSNGVGSVAVTWGYGDRNELEAAQPDRIVDSTNELLDYIRQAALTSNEA